MVLLRHAWLAASLLAAGCYEPFPPAGAPCSLDDVDPCPNGQACIRGQCRVGGGDGIDGSIIPEIDASTIDGPATDVDNDGVANAMDNCPGAGNLDQHDEDKDGVGDVCDNCPHLANPNQARTNEATTINGAGDACDPRPTMAGDTIQKFYSFHVQPGGTTTTGTWDVVEDAYRYTGGGRGTLIVAGVRDKVVIEIAGQVDSNTPNLGIAISAGEANGRYHECGYYDCVNCNGLPDDFHTAFIDYWDGQDYLELDGFHEQNQRLTGTFTIRMSADSTTDRITCTTTDTARGTDTVQSSQADLLVPGLVGVYSDFASYRLRYMVVFGQP